MKAKILYIFWKVYTFIMFVVLQSFRLLRRFYFAIVQTIFSIANWGRKQLDKKFNIAQKEYLHTIIHESETKKGRQLDTVLICLIVASMLVVVFESVASFHNAYWWTFFVLEWCFTIVFTVEYVLRLYSAKKPMRYATSFFGLVDFLSIAPAYLGVFFIGAQHLIIVRILRLLRIFRILKMGHFVKEGSIILNALRASKTKIYVFISFMMLMSIVIGSVMYIVEGGVNPDMNNIPKGIYWAIVTLTTVGYGDITPITAQGRVLATIVMVMGYGVIAIPTGIVTAEISSRVMNMKEVILLNCKYCGQTEHHTQAEYCHKCGNSLDSSKNNLKKTDSTENLQNPNNKLPSNS